MKKYIYEHATVYITKPTEAQIENLKRSTEDFIKRLLKEGLIFDDYETRNN